MNKRYYKKKGASHKERLRCPLCGKLSLIAYFSIDHRLDICRYTYAGRGKISVAVVLKDATFMQTLKQSIAGRLKELLEQFTGLKYFSELELSKSIKTTTRPMIIAKPVPMIATNIIPFAESIPIPVSANVRPVKVVIN